METLKRLVSKLKQLLWPKEVIAGLEIKDSAARLIQIEGDTLKKAVISLEPGIIENGMVRDKNRLIQNLLKLHAEFTRHSKREVPVIVSIPSAAVYTQVFSTPALSEKDLEEAAELNLKSISPIDLKTGYADWQKIGVQERDGKIEFLGAFVKSSAADDFIECLESAKFVPVAVEFPALAIGRSIKEFSAGVNLEKPQVVLNVASDGIDFFVLRNGNLYFNYFVPWKLILEDSGRAREILFADFKDTILRELKKVATFYLSHWQGKLETLVLISQALNQEITEFIKINFPFKVIDFKLRKFSDLPPPWLGALGSAVRGEIPRAGDNLISLMAVGTEKGYYQSEIKFFIKVWRDVFLATLAFLALVFVLVDSLLYQTNLKLANQLQEIISAPHGTEVAELQEQARRFNQLVDKAAAAREKSLARSPIFSKINSLITRDITLTRVLVDAQQPSGLLSGRAVSEAAAIALKNALIKEGFKEVSLPLSTLIANVDQSVSFTISFKL